MIWVKVLILVLFLYNKLFTGKGKNDTKPVTW